MYAEEPGKLLGITGVPTLILHACDGVQEVKGASELEPEYVTVPVKTPLMGNLIQEIKLDHRTQCLAILGEHTYVAASNHIIVLNAKGIVQHCTSVERCLAGFGYGIAVTQDKVYMSRKHSDCVDVFTNPTCTNGSDSTYYKFSIGGGRGNGQGQLLRPMGMAIFAERLYVVDSGNSRVQVYGLDGKFLLSWGAKGDGPGEFGLIRDLAIHEVWGGGFLSRPVSISVYDEKLYILDDHGVQIVALDGGTRIGSLDVHHAYLARSTAVSQTGKLWVGYPSRLRVFE